MRRRGFTLLELLVVIAVIAVLAGLGIPAYAAIRNSMRNRAAQALVSAVATAVDQYRRDSWPVPQARADGTFAFRAVPLWDWNGDQVLDGFPAADTAGDATLRAALDAGGYRGFAAHTAFAASAGAYDQATGRILDPWKRPLRFAWATGVYGSERFGVWSTGRDGERDAAWPAGSDGPEGDPRSTDNARSWGR